MKRLFIFILSVIFSLSLLTGCETEFMYDGAGESSYGTGVQELSGTDKHDISSEALEKAENTVERDGVYTTPALVAAYIHTFNKLPSNYITKNEAIKLGWDAKSGNLNEVAPGKSIGGDNFGNYEKLLPNGRYKECDVNYEGGRRNSERIIYSADGDVYYTADHYNSFIQLY